MINLNTAIEQLEHGNPTTLTLDPKHPGLQDSLYQQRREQLFHLAREYRIQNKGFPEVDYTDAEHALWRSISEKLTPLHEEKAASLYLKGLKTLAISRQHMPKLGELSDKLLRSHDIGLVPAEGILSTASFYYYLAQRRMPCTMFLRHFSHPEYTPEPDTVHDLIGHVPMLTNPVYADLIELIGMGVKNATPKQLVAWSRVYWFTIEFSLIEENNNLKIFGAGLLSSYGEMIYAYSDKVQRKPYDIDEIIHTHYDNSRMQDILFIIPSLDILKTEIQKLLTRFAN